MRTSIDLSAVRIWAPNDLARKAQRSRTSLILETIDEYFRTHGAGAEHEDFGLWAEGEIDGSAFQRRLRSEW